MKLFSLGRVAMLLLPVGFALTIAGFSIANDAARIGLQIAGVAVLIASIVMGQQFVRELQRSLDDA